jgi:hypothetical protein
MSKATTFIVLAIAFAAVTAACGGKVVFVAAGTGGAGGAASTTSLGPTTVSVGTCMTCDCMPQGCTDAATDVVATAGVGGGPSSCAMTCAELLEGDGAEQLCANVPAPAEAAFEALGNCICEVGVCGGASGQCSLTCAGTPETNPGCGSCEMTAITGACATEASACAAN